MANEFLPLATGGGSNVITQVQYDALAARLTGFQAGVAKSNEVNKALRQATSMAAMLGQFIGDYGALDAIDDGNVANLVRDFTRSIQRGAYARAVATGTANAWVVAPTPAVAAYAAGLPLYIKAPATNTSTTVNANVSGLGDRRIKKADGTDPAIGDLVVNRWYPTIDDGVNILVLTTLPSDVGAQKIAFNVQQTSSITRTIKSGIVGASDFLTGSYTKKSATSDLVVEFLSNTFDGGTGANMAWARLTLGASIIYAVQSSSTVSMTSTAATATRKISGVAPGVLSWALAHGRNDATAWTSRICPNTTDAAFMPASTPCSVLIYEVEP